jgi:hypothetical protein
MGLLRESSESKRNVYKYQLQVSQSLTEKMIPERVSKGKECMRRDIEGKRKSKERATCLGVVSFWIRY